MDCPAVCDLGEDLAPVLGVGCDVVAIPSFRDGMVLPGSRMTDLFSVRERRQCVALSKAHGDDEIIHLAARWAGKECVVKAWCAALGDSDFPYAVDGMPWSRIEILDDRRSVPHVVLGDDVAEALVAGLGRRLSAGSGPIAVRWSPSLSHDGNRALAFVVLSACRRVSGPQTRV